MSEIRNRLIFLLSCVSGSGDYLKYVRWIDESLQGHEEFIGLHGVALIDAATITAVIKDVLLRLNFSLTKCRGQ